jgi:hypothetical protein
VVVLAPPLLAHGSLPINIHGGTELRGGEGVIC